jgi:peptidoglycan-associated lipoprotein
MMKLRLALVLALVVIPVVGCAKRPVPVAAAPAPASPPPGDNGAAAAAALARARADSIAAADLARRNAEALALRQQTARAQEVLGNVVYFEYDSFNINGDSEDQLRTKASILRSNPALQIRIEGHADERGSTEYNIALGQRRAEAVRTFLTGYGITPDRLATLSYGKERPAVDGTTESAYAQNRRAEFATTAGSITAVPAEVR